MAKANDMKIWSLGMSQGNWPPFMFEKRLSEIFPDPNDVRKGVIRFMIELGICGISALAISKKHRSTSEWADNLEKLLDRIPLLVKIQNPLLIIGESGTGKEDMAKLLHYVGKGKDKPFRPVNCSAIPKDMLESELFGHTKGAFTGATKAKIGLIEMAKGGSIFLDELGKMEDDHQYKLLRVIEEQKIHPIGSTKDIPVKDVQFIIAIQPGNDKNIVHDLLNRLNMHNAITLPTLSERLRGDPDLIPTILRKLQINGNLRSEKESEEIKKLEKEVKEAESALSGLFVEVIDKITGERCIKTTPQTKKKFAKYHSLNAKHQKLTTPFTLSDQACDKLFYHKGYEGKNFRELENILKHALIEAHIAKRKIIIIDDLPEKVRNNNVDQENIESYTHKDLKTIPLSDIIQYADKVKESIIREKIREVGGSGKIKPKLRAEGKEAEYQNFWKKLKRSGIDLKPTSP